MPKKKEKSDSYFSLIKIYEIAQWFTNDGSVTARPCGLMGSFNRHASHGALLFIYTWTTAQFLLGH